jgi:hypothetical protein
LPAVARPASARGQVQEPEQVPAREPVKVRASVPAQAQVPVWDLAQEAVSSWGLEAVNRSAAIPLRRDRSHRCRGRNR